MNEKRSGNGEAGLGDTVQSLIVSGIRLSAGLTLYGIGQLQKVFDAAGSDQGLPAAAERIQSTFQDLSGSLEKDMDETRKEALRSVSRVSAKALERMFAALSPEAVLEAGNRLRGRREVSREEVFPAVTTTGAAPLAVDVLSAPPME